MGPGGDYVTYPSSHSAFGRLLGRQIHEIWEAMSKPRPFTLVEMGGGRGDLARDIAEGLQARTPALWDSLEWVFVDESPTLRSYQELVSKDLVSSKVMPPHVFFSEKRYLVGCVISNEFVDALPVHLVEWRDGALLEVFVHVGETEIHEALTPPSDPAISRYLDALGAQLVEGQRTEVHLAAVKWVQQVAEVLERGALMTLDFGYTAPEYFHPLRSGGTLLSYRDHRASADPYALPGGEDLCAHVNFSALMWAGQQVGLTTTGLVPQDRFLLRLGLLQEMEELEQRRGEMDSVSFWKEKLSLRRLMIPQAPQGGFGVLIQHKGWSPPPLSGLS